MPAKGNRDVQGIEVGEGRYLKGSLDPRGGIFGEEGSCLLHQVSRDHGITLKAGKATEPKSITASRDRLGVHSQIKDQEPASDK